jgi:hypothetical protein
MVILDFLFFYLVRWFKISDRRKRKTVSSYPDQTSYVLSICLGLWLMTICLTSQYLIFHTFKSKIPNYVFIILTLLIYLAIRQIYIVNKRYDLILKHRSYGESISFNAGMTISLVFFFSGILSLIIMAIVLHSL